MFFADKLRRGERFSAAGLAVSYALLIVSHLPTALIFSPVPILYVIGLAERGNKMRATIKAAGAMILGIGLSATYLLPALALREFVSMQEMSKPEINFENWFVLTSVLARGFSAYLSRIVLSMAAVAGGAYFIARRNQSEAVGRECGFWAAVAAGTILMMTPLSKPLWKLLPVLQNVQFPFRFNTVLCVATASLIAPALASFKPTASFRSAAFPNLLALSALVWILVLPLAAWREYKVHPVTRAGYRALIDNNQDAPEYRPRWAERDVFYALLGELRQAKRLEQVSVVEGSAEVAVENWTPRSVSLRVNSHAGAVLRVGQLFFPGWRVRTEDGRELKPQPANTTELLEFAMPAGSQRLRIKLSAGVAERGGQIVSAISLLSLIGAAYWIGTRSPSNVSGGKYLRFRYAFISAANSRRLW
ncbi:MAG TPA: hypothetical protein PKC13_02640 [Blastocatellia bacterium]|nr:hypothetical protein [Blastocatellia bacterium]HMY70413.1 hypothetical protein [Blastocatellia bacterium]